MADPFDALFGKAEQSADDGKDFLQPQRNVPRDVYRQVFSTPQGQLVLQDLHDRYVNVTRADPHGTAQEAFYREGMAQVVFDIVENVTHEEDTDGQEG